MNIPSKITDDNLNRIFTEGIKAVLRNKYQELLEEAKKKLEEEFVATIKTGAERVTLELGRIYHADSPGGKLELLVKILEPKK